MTQAALIVGSLFCLLLLLSYTAVDEDFYGVSPFDPGMDLAPGLIPGMYLWGALEVDQDVFTGYELALAPHAPMNRTRDDSGRAKTEIHGPLLRSGVDSGTEACNADELPDLTGMVALVKRGKCNLFAKLVNCQQRGAIGVVFDGGDLVSAHGEAIELVRMDARADPATTNPATTNPASKAPATTDTIMDSTTDSSKLADSAAESSGPGLAAQVRVPAMIVSQPEFERLERLETCEAFMWTLLPGLDFSLARFVLLLFVRPLIMLCILLVILVASVRGQHKHRRSPPEVVQRLPSRRFGGDTNRWQQTQCTVCLEDFEADAELMTLPCEHEFHRPCVSQWLLTRRGACPLCWRDIPDEQTALLA